MEGGTVGSSDSQRDGETERERSYFYVVKPAVELVDCGCFSITNVSAPTKA